MICHYYDVESLENAFTVSVFKPEAGHVDVYALCDGVLAGWNSDDFARECSKRIRRCNPANFADGDSAFFDLATEEGVLAFVGEFGLWADGTTGYQLARLAHDTDDGFDGERDYYLLGYNSQQYDTTMIAAFLAAAFVPGAPPAPSADGLYLPTPKFKGTSARSLRGVNDMMFSERFRKHMPHVLAAAMGGSGEPQPIVGPDGALIMDWQSPGWAIRREMLATGRYVDVARLNEKQQKVGLKRLLGLLGHQILEFDKLDGANAELGSLNDLMDLIAYNVSDVVNLEELFNHPVYNSQFEVKRQMIGMYPELVYEIDAASHEVIVDPKHVRRDRLFADSTSQQLASRALCPDGRLRDSERVSFWYPSHAKALEYGTPRRDVLEEAADFFEERVGALIDSGYAREACEAFQSAYDYYSSIRGENFNDSDRHKSDYGLVGVAKSLAGFGKRPAGGVYVGPDGKPTSCYYIFSAGGIHGAEYDKALYEADIEAFECEVRLFEFVRGMFPGEDGAVRLANSVQTYATPIGLEFPDGGEHYVREFLKSGFTKRKAEWKTLARPALFKTAGGRPSLDDRYAMTSFAEVNHEDFTSYYPGLLRQMDAFENRNVAGDRYGEIFESKQRYGEMRKDPTLSQEERDLVSLKRNGVKLVLNTASGAGDSGFDNPVRMNNNVIAMRVIGQLFTWRIAQAQALVGARVVSTNTDGLYTELDEGVNNSVLEREAVGMNVEIVPERLKLISKDANNRVEYRTLDDGSVDVLSAAGGTLTCWEGPDPSKALAHPALVDRVLCRYLIYVAETYGQEGFAIPFNEQVGARMLDEVLDRGDTVSRLLLLQNVIASNPGKSIYAYGEDGNGSVRALQHYTRVFVMAPGAPGTVRVRAAYTRTVPKARATRRASEGLPAFNHDVDALEILSQVGVDAADVEAEGKEAASRKVTGVDPGWSMLVENGSLFALGAERAEWILANADRAAYLSLVRDAYENCWRNGTSGGR